MDADKMRYYASRGHLGHAALLDPEAYVAANATPEPTALQQAVQELPGDIKSAFSTEGLSNSLDLIGSSIKGGLSDLMKK